jgi:hypothetical protein
MYIPIVVAMAAQQNVLAAVEGGPMVVHRRCRRGHAVLRAGAVLGRVTGRRHG